MAGHAHRRRRLVDLLLRGACVAALALALVPLVSIIVHVVAKGASALSLAVLTRPPLPVGESGGGFGNALLGSAILVALGCALGVPLGVLGGVYLSEFADTKLGRSVRFAADVMAGVPSIVVGIFMYTLFVLRMRHFSALAGGAALAVIMLPTVVRTTEELLKLVPSTLREAGLALGAPKWRVTLSVVLRTGAPGIATGVMLAVARIAGETAPLLFTALGSRFWPSGLNEPTASLPVQIYTYAVSPYDEWRAQAWAAALVLVLFVLALNLISRLAVRSYGGKRWST